VVIIYLLLWFLVWSIAVYLENGLFLCADFGFIVLIYLLLDITSLCL